MDKSISFALGILSCLLVVVAFFYRDKLKLFKKFGYLGVFLVSLLGNMIIMAPSAPLIAAAGSLYNPWIVGFVAAFGNIIGQLLFYTVGSAVSTTNMLESNWYRIAYKYMETNGFLTVFVLACFPNPVIDVGALLSGATKYPMWKYLVASFFGKWFKYTVFAAVGKQFIRI